MSRRGRIVIVSLLLMTGLVLGAELMLRSIALGQLRSSIEGDLAARLGVRASVDLMRLELLPRPHLHAEGVQVVREDGSMRATVGLLELEIELRPLLRRTVVVDSVHVEDVDFQLTRSSRRVSGALTESLEAFATEKDLTPSKDDDWFDFHVRRMSGRDLRLFVGSPATPDVRSIRVDHFQLGSVDRSGAVFVQTRGEIDGGAFDLRGRGAAIRELVAPGEPYPVEITGRIFDADIEARGSLRAPLDLSGIELEVSARLPDVAVTGWPLPDLGPILLEGSLSDADGTLGFEHISLATLGRDPLEASIEGRVDELARFRDLELTARARAGRIDFLRTWLGLRVPDDVEAEATATLGDQDGLLGGRGQLHMEASGAAVTLDVQGRYGDLLHMAEIDVELEVGAVDLAALARLVPDLPSLPEIGPVTGRGRLRDRQGTLALESIQLEVATPDGPAPWAELKGQIDDVVGRTGISLAARFAVRSAERFGEAIGQALPPIGALEGKAKLSDRDGSLGLEEIHLATTGEGPVDVRLSATLDDVLERDEIAADIEMRAEDLSMVGAILGREWPRLGPLAASARVSGSDEMLRADDARIAIGETRMEGQLAARFTEGERPFLRAHLQSPLARLADFLDPDARRTGPDETPLRMQLPFEQLRAIDLDLGLQIGVWEGAVGKVRDLHGALWLEDGRLILSDVRGRYRRGRVSGWARIDTQTLLPEVSLRLDATGVDLAKLLSQIDGKAEATGLADFQFDLASQGETAEQLLLGLGGRARGVARDGTAVSKYARRFVVNLATTAFPFLRVESAPRIGCAVADFAIEDGIATVQELFLEEGDIVIVGRGTVDLPGGRYDLRFTPRARTQGLLSVTPEVEVTGRLEAPEFTPVRNTVISSLGNGILSAARRAGMRLANPFGPRADAEQAAAAACSRVGELDDDSSTTD